MLFDRRTLLPTLLIATAAACTSSTQVPKTQPPQASPCKTKKVGLGVVNGKPIDDATFPSVGWISAYNAQGDTNCSGAVVCDRVVLSASHCVAEQDGSSGWVYHFDTRGDLPSGEALKTTGTLVKERRMHPKYVMGGDGTPIPDHDVALFVLDTPIDAMMYPVWNPATKLDKADALATIIGYGYSDANESVYGKKLRAEMSFYGLDSNAIAVVVTDVDDSKGDTCGGDSGSTLWIKDITDGQMKGIGVLSQGDTDGCGKGTQSWWASLIDIDNRSWLTSQLKELCTGTTAFDIAKPTRTGAASGSGSGSGSGSASDASSGDGSASGSSSSSGSASKDEGSGSGAGSGTSSGAASEAGDC